jgi:hypothetical protein
VQLPSFQLQTNTIKGHGARGHSYAGGLSKKSVLRDWRINRNSRAWRYGALIEKHNPLEKIEQALEDFQSKYQNI